MYGFEREYNAVYSRVARDYIANLGLIASSVFIAKLKFEAGFNSTVFPFPDCQLMTALFLRW